MSKSKGRLVAEFLRGLNSDGKLADAASQIADSTITSSKLAPASLVTESEGIGNNDNDTTLPTSAAVKDYVDNNAGGSGAGVTVYSTLDNLPAPSSVSEGSMALVDSTNRLYIQSDNGWYNIAIVNTTPTISGVNSSYSLAQDGTATVVTMVGTDAEGLPITYSIASDTSGSVAAVTQGTGSNTNVFTITPSTSQSNAGNFSLTFRASDGVNIASAVSQFTLSFSVSVEYLVIGGGGGGGAGSAAGGGGGAGGYRTGTLALNGGTSYSITVGAGGAGSTSPDNNNASNGSNSVFSTITAAGGGGGAGTGPQNASPSYSGPGLDGGSGGGGRYGGAGGSGNTPSTSPSQGNDGGDSTQTNARGSGGGGGAGGAGADGTSSAGGAGGAGLASSITGTSVTRAGGGGGSTWSNAGGSPGSGGSGGGGAGAPPSGGTASGTAGTSNTGGGGGGNGRGVAGPSGGSGVVIIAAQQAAASVSGTYSLDTSSRSGYHVYTFTAGTGSITF